MTAVDIPGRHGEIPGRHGEPASECDAVATWYRTDGAGLAKAASRIRADLPLLVLDAALVVGCYSAALLLRFDGAVPPRYWDHFPGFVVLALVAHLGASWAFGLYRQMWRHASVAEARCVIGSALAATSTVFVASALAARQPVSVVVVGGAASMMFSGAVRFQSRLFALNRGGVVAGMRVAIVGAGESGAMIVRDLRRNPDVGLVPVAVLDDDSRTHGHSLAGVPVLGPVDSLPAVVRELGIHQVVLAIPSAGRELVDRVARLAESARVAVKITPAASEVLGGALSVRDVRDLRIEDLLGRAQVVTDLDAVRRLLRGRRVLITGAGGSIGSEIARQVALCDPARLIMLDHDETHLFEAAATVPGQPVQLLADVRDAVLLRQAVLRERPDIVFHAAAHKHVPVLESHPCQAVSTNVLGTANLIAAAGDARVDRLVFISTDKAVCPASVMGASKWLAEQLVIDASTGGTRHCAVRFGNVAGSRGSVIPTFSRQIAAGGPVTVTDPEMTRYFMSVHEAVQLVLQAAALAEGGEVFMLDMGEPVNILDLAERMIRLSGRNVGTDVQVVLTGPRPGEKLREALRGPGEAAQPTEHGAVVRLRPRTIQRAALHAGVDRLAALAAAGDDVGASTALFALVHHGVGAEPDVIDLVELEAGFTSSSTSSQVRAPKRAQLDRLVLLAAPCPATNALYHALVDTFGEVIVVLEPRVSRWWLAKRRARTLGAATVLGQALFSAVAVPVLGRRAQGRIAEIARENDMNLSPIDRPALHIPSVNSDEARSMLLHLRPAVAVVCGTRIISPATLACVDTTFVNVHAGVAPQYRGVHGAYWALAEGRSEMAGTTVHVVDAGIDTGPIIGQATFSVTDEDSFATYPYLHLAAGMPILLDSVKRLLAGDNLEIVPPMSETGPSRLCSHPTLWGYLATRARASVR